MGKQGDVQFGRYRFGDGSFQYYVSDDGVNECFLGEFNAPSLQSFDVDSYVVRRVALIFNLMSQALKLSNDG